VILCSKKPLWLYQGFSSSFSSFGCSFSGSMSFFRVLRLQREVETLDRRRAFNRQLFADALLFFKALDLVTTGTAVLLDQQRAFFFQIRGSSMNEASA
jgi:hypothetical protein